MNPYRSFVTSFANLLRDGTSLPLGGVAPRPKPSLPQNAPIALLFSPHPDDECLIGGLALRLVREAGMRIVNVAVTQGSNRDRQQPRLKELKNACDWIGFDLEQTAPNGLEKISLKTLENDSAHWAAAVKVIAEILGRHQPRAIFFPHKHDWNSTHVGTHFLVMDALRSMPSSFECFLIETEFWGQMTSPNLMVELSSDDVADLIAALSFHVGEVQRNPYHLRMPAWLQDNVRRGAELVGGQGGAAPDFPFATLYRLRRWKSGSVQDVLPKGRILSAQESASSLLE